MIQLDRHDESKLEVARATLRELESVLIAYSGGVDSSLLLKLALAELGDNAVAVLASSPAYPESEQQEARTLAHQSLIRTKEERCQERLSQEKGRSEAQEVAEIAQPLSKSYRAGRFAGASGRPSRRVLFPRIFGHRRAAAVE